MKPTLKPLIEYSLATRFDGMVQYRKRREQMLKAMAESLPQNIKNEPLLEIPDVVPPILYRFFPTEQEADAFATGTLIKPGTLSHWRTTEDRIRGDNGENTVIRRVNKLMPGDPFYHEKVRHIGIQLAPGINDFSIQGDIDFQVVDEDRYGLCLTTANNSYVRKFGRYGVKVHDPIGLLTVLTEAVAQAHPTAIASCGLVRYGSRTVPIDDWHQEIDPLLKPPRFELEREFRLLWKCVDKNGSPMYELQRLTFSCPAVSAFVNRL